jgi:hypothetical protein
MKNKFLILLLGIFITSCGFKVIDKSKLLNFEIKEINTTGNKRINFKLKNKLNLNTNLNEKKSIKISLNTKKIKNIKEKNIKNEITKYEINITTSVNYIIIGENYSGEFSVTEYGDYSVATDYSQTLTNEKNLVNLLADNVGDKIVDELISKFNEL